MNLVLKTGFNMGYLGKGFIFNNIISKGALLP